MDSCPPSARGQGFDAGGGMGWRVGENNGTRAGLCWRGEGRDGFLHARGHGIGLGSRRGRISRLSKSAQIHLLALKDAICSCWQCGFVLGISGVGVIRYDYRFGINSCLRLTGPGMDIRFEKSLASGPSSGVEKLADLLRCIGFRRMMVAGTGNLRQWGDGSEEGVR